MAHSAMQGSIYHLEDCTKHSEICQELMDFFAQRDFQAEMGWILSLHMISSPTQKDVELMFQFLYRQIAPSYRFKKSLDAEMPHLLRRMCYPLKNKICKSHIVAMDPKHWPIFLSLLHWMMQSVQTMEQDTRSTYDDACVKADYNMNAHMIFDRAVSKI
jgi:kinetochore protein NDC80